MIIIGIDPGKNGGIAKIDIPEMNFRDPVIVEAMPDTAHELHKKLADLVDLDAFSSGYHGMAYIEKISTAFWGGARNTGELMRNVGWCEMALAAHKIPFIEVPAKAWQKAVGANKAPAKLVKNMTPSEQSAWYRQKKNHNKILAQKLFPQIKVTHAVADALLIAYYGVMRSRE